MHDAINRICFLLSLLCIIAASTLSIMAIWELEKSEEILGRSLATLGVIFLACLMTIAVNNMALSGGSKRQKTGKSLPDN